MDYESFSLRLAKLREQKNISAREMSLRMGQNPGYINNIESGKTKPSLAGFFNICEFLEIHPRDFFDTQSSNPVGLSKLVQELKKLDDRQLELLTALVKEMSKS